MCLSVYVYVWCVCLVQKIKQASYMTGCKNSTSRLHPQTNIIKNYFKIYINIFILFEKEIRSITVLRIVFARAGLSQ